MNFLRSWAIAALIVPLAWGMAHAADFYTPPALLRDAAHPGTLLRTETMPGAPPGSTARRILYTSLDEQGEPVAVSGFVVVPDHPAPAGGRPVVAWAHPTSGVVTRCAPSLALTAFSSVPGLHDMLERGYVVVATDYPGLGTPGPHPYLVGGSEARAVLDSVRAVHAISGANAGNRFAVWGHSQGGQAALFAGLIARQYAPELELVGIAAAAPATDLVALLRDDFATAGGRNLTAMTLWSWTRVYGLPIDQLVVPSAMPAVDALSGECIESLWDVAMRLVSQRGLEHGFLTVPDLTRLVDWRRLLEENSPGLLPPDVPLLLVQGDADGLVRPEVTKAYGDRQCAAKVSMRLVILPGVNHGFAGRDGARVAMAWIAQRFDHFVPPDDCSLTAVR